MLYPKIGIRPVIDGRWGGVRESLENQTVTMANNAAKLISGTLRYRTASRWSASLAAPPSAEARRPRA